jgi:flavodoxin
MVFIKQKQGDTMIFYFSGTGNSHYAAQVIASVTGEDLISING